MTREETAIRAGLIINPEDEKYFLDFLTIYGHDKAYECFKNMKDLLGESKKPTLDCFLTFMLYENGLSEMLFTILRLQEDQVKGFLSNVYNDYQVQVISKPSTRQFTKDKYYFLIPYKGNKFLEIRTHNYQYGPVDYYTAIKEMDFGDINIIFTHQDKCLIEEFSSNPNIIEELDQTRKVRNYVYHHNLLFSLGKDLLKNVIILVLRNIAHKQMRDYFIKQINDIPKTLKQAKIPLPAELMIYLNAEDVKLIKTIKPRCK